MENIYRFNCSGYHAKGCYNYRIMYFNIFEMIYLFFKKAKCFRCYHYNDELEICSELGNCCTCGCNFYTKRNNKCMKFRKSN